MNDNSRIAEFIKKILKENWNNVFIFDSLTDTSYSYGDFFKIVLLYKKWYQALNLKEDDIICLIMNNSVELVFLYFASLLLQLRVVPIDPLKGKQDINEIISQIKFKKIISNSLDINYIQDIIYVDKETKTEKKRIDVEIFDLNNFDNIDYTKEFLISFTSGSTGVPKGVVHSFSNLYYTSLAFNKRFNFNKSHRFYHNLPMTYMAGILNQIFLPFLCESQIVIGDRFNISAAMRFWEKPIKYNVNVFWIIPTILALLIRIDRGPQGINYANDVDIIGCCGTAPLNSKTKEEFENKYGIKLYESYGLSETLFVSTNFPGNDQYNCVGPPLDGVELVFSEEKEILIKTPWNLLKYANFDSRNYFINDFFLSGDIGKIEDKGRLFITDRKKDLIIRGGINISPKKIQNFIQTYNYFDDIVVLGVEDQILVEKVLCAFVPNQNFKDGYKKSLNRDLIEKFGQDYQIDEFLQMDSIPKNINGKVDKFEIKTNFARSNNDFTN